MITYMYDIVFNTAHASHITHAFLCTFQTEKQCVILFKISSNCFQRYVGNYNKKDTDGGSLTLIDS